MGNAYRECLENGTWASRINYSQCEPILDDKRKYDVHYRVALVVNYLGHCVSVAALVAAFLLFLALRSIRCLRNVIHWNLITTFILRNVMWFLLQLIDHEVHESNEVWCCCVTTIFNYFVVTNFFWMFVEGCYLHTAIVMTYSTEHLRKRLFLFIGWCIPCPIIVAWAIGKLYYENEQCWFGKEPGDLVDYIYQGPIILVLLVLRQPGDGAADGKKRVCGLLFSPDLHPPLPPATPSEAQPTAPSLERWYQNEA
ncbi:corticotropin-releasing factor receptor 2 [Leptonychotes weddellii]|uniref:Corticotropin-releasing factor receptor 2 n=1 Tax=Leptonychotes weddellii TaxID=9713 RepID=A0A7F8R2P0_LEPWE|nr:corticotropin-releasing factor receptor 2 [Leptonychotes weddellii]